MKVTEIILLKDALEFQLSYSPNHKNSVKYLRDIPGFKFQYALDKNFEILKQEVKSIEKALKLPELLDGFRKRFETETKGAKTDAEKAEVGKKMDAEYLAEKQKLMDEAPEVEVKFYEFKDIDFNSLDVDRSGFWVLKHFVQE